MKPRLTIAIPSWQNQQQLCDALVSLTRHTDFDGRIIVINNGGADYRVVQASVPREIDWIDAPQNLGWSNAINEALGHTESELFCMLNDDVVFHVDREFWARLLHWFDVQHDPIVWRDILPPWARIAGVGPISNYAFGYQNARMFGLPDSFLSTVLIGFCAVYRTALLKELGGLDATLPGGDDFDLAIRLRAAGFGLIVDRRCYLHHHGSQTGPREGSAGRRDWDSQAHQADCYNALIRKHGLKAWYNTVNGPIQSVNGGWERHLAVPSIDNLYEQTRVQPSDVSEHVEVLRTFAESCDHITEFGTDDGTTATVWLAARPKKLVCYDIVRKPEVDELALAALSCQACVPGTEFVFCQENTLDATIEPTDLLWIDDKHTYDQVKAELERHAARVRRYILFHDTVFCGRQGDDGGRGIMPAITEWLRLHPEWRIVAVRMNNNGVVALARVTVEPPWAANVSWTTNTTTNKITVTA